MIFRVKILMLLVWFNVRDGLCRERYRVAENVKLPLRIIPAVQEEGRSRVNINLKVSADFNYKQFGSNIVVKVGWDRSGG